MNAFFAKTDGVCEFAGVGDQDIADLVWWPGGQLLRLALFKICSVGGGMGGGADAYKVYLWLRRLDLAP